MGIHPQDFDNEDKRSFIPQGFESTSATEQRVQATSKNATADRDRRGGSTSRPSRNWSSVVVFAGILVFLIVAGVLLMRGNHSSPTPKPETSPLPSVDNAHQPPSTPIQPGPVPSSGSGAVQTPHKGVQPSKPARKSKPSEEEDGHPLGHGKRDGENPKW